jgi:hypothetical protein
MNGYDDTGRRLTEIWSEVLHIDPPGPDDDFFEIGGDSLLATKVVLLARRAWGVDLTVRVLLDAPVLRDLAVEVDRRRAIADAGVHG